MKADFFHNHCILPQDTVYLMPALLEDDKKGTIIHTIQGETTVPMHIKTVLKKYYRLSNVNEAFVRDMVYQCTNKKILFPIPIRPNIVLMPVKTRTADRTDNLYGYVNLAHIQKIIASGVLEFSSRIIFQNKSSLLTPQTLRSLEHNYLCARYVQKNYFTACAEATAPYESDHPSFLA